MPTPRGNSRRSGRSVKETLQRRVAEGAQFLSLKGNKSFKWILEKIDEEIDLAHRKLLTCIPEQMEEFRQREKAFVYVKTVIDAKILAGENAAQNLENTIRREEGSKK